MATKSQSIQAGQLLLQKLSSDEAFLAKVNAAKSYGDFLDIAKTAGHDLSGLSEQEAIGLAKGDIGALGEISDEDLAAVAGGTNVEARPDLAVADKPFPTGGGGSPWNLPKTGTW